MSLRLLFITSKIDERHDDLGFSSLWAQAFVDAGFEVTVICGEKGETRLTCPIYSLGHIPGESQLRTLWHFEKLITTLSYDRVFVHLAQRWVGAGAWWWRLKKIPTYLWYTHYTRPLSLRLGELAIKRIFTATEECVPHWKGDPRKVVTGHGIDTHFWNVEPLADNQREPATHLLAVHRISRSKRFDLVLKTLALLPPQYHLTHYGRPQDPRSDPEYYAEIQRLIDELHLKDRVTFKGAVPMPELRKIYSRFQTFINLVPRTIDKTVLEAMYCGLTPIMIRGQADAIGYPDAPKDEEPQTIADFIQNMKPHSRDELRDIVEQRHSLKKLIEKMEVYIRSGT